MPQVSCALDPLMKVYVSQLQKVANSAGVSRQEGFGKEESAYNLRSSPAVTHVKHLLFTLASFGTHIKTCTSSSLRITAVALLKAAHSRLTSGVLLLSNIHKLFAGVSKLLQHQICGCVFTAVLNNRKTSTGKGFCTVTGLACQLEPC